MVPEQRVKTCTYQVCKMVPEQRVKTCTYQVCQMVKECYTKEIPYKVCKMVAEKCVKQVPYTVCKPVCYTKTINCMRSWCRSSVPYTVTKCVPVVVCKQVPVTVCCPVPCCKPRCCAAPKACGPAAAVAATERGACLPSALGQKAWSSHNGGSTLQGRAAVFSFSCLARRGAQLPWRRARTAGVVPEQRASCLLPRTLPAHIAHALLTKKARLLNIKGVVSRTCAARRMTSRWTTVGVSLAETDTALGVVASRLFRWSRPVRIATTVVL